MQVKIYLIVNRINFKKYIGLTSRTVARRTLTGRKDPEESKVQEESSLR